MKPTLMKATLSDYPVIQNMARFYVYDMSRSCGRVPGAFDWSCPADGLYECIDLKPYFVESSRHAFLIKVGQENAGFAVINKIGTTPDIDWNIGEFFVLAKFQGMGVGRQAAYELFNQFPGRWEVAAMIENTPAQKVWAKVINDFTQGSFSQERKVSPLPVPHDMIVFRFDSRNN